jgi:hypothetical protein
MVAFARIDMPPTVEGSSVEGARSVIWLIDRDRQLAGFIGGLLRELAPEECWGIVSDTVDLVGPITFEPPAPTLSAQLGLDVAARREITFVGGEMLFGAVVFESASFRCEIAAIPTADVSPFWGLFLHNQPGPFATVFPAGLTGAGRWVDAAAHLSLVEGAFPLKFAASGSDVVRSLREAFFDQTIHSGGFAMTKISPEMVGPGVAITGERNQIDNVEAFLRGQSRVDAISLARARQLASHWPWD